MHSEGKKINGEYESPLDKCFNYDSPGESLQTVSFLYDEPENLILTIKCQTNGTK